MMLARAAAISSSFTNRTAAGIHGVRIGQGCGRGDIVVIATATFPAREVDAAADLHRWHLGAMGMLFRSVSPSPPSTLSTNVGGGGKRAMRESAAPPEPTLFYTNAGTGLFVIMTMPDSKLDDLLWYAMPIVLRVASVALSPICSAIIL
jgi:hypothetical protein